jgi:hypothetical protein
MIERMLVTKCFSNSGYEQLLNKRTLFTVINKFKPTEPGIPLLQKYPFRYGQAVLLCKKPMYFVVNYESYRFATRHCFLLNLRSGSKS